MTLTLTIDQAAAILGDPQAVARGYLTSEALEAATAIAVEHCGSTFAGNPEYQAEVGAPDHWWMENNRSYALRSLDFPKSRTWSVVCQLADHLIATHLSTNHKPL